jgi:hypothetical protein
MTAEDRDKYYTVFKFDDFADSYFASRRFLAALDYEHPSLAEFIRLRTALIGQFDLNNHDGRLHSQFLTVKAAAPYKNILYVDAGGALELLQATGEDISLGMTGEIGLSWMLPTVISDRLSLLGRFASGTDGNGGRMGAFSPLTTKTQGAILKAKFSGIALVQAEYSARLHQNLSADLTGIYFFRSDRETYLGGRYTAKDGGLIGGELSARLIWIPASDLRLTLGGGAFLPQLGNAADDGAPTLWRAELGAVFELY